MGFLQQTFLLLGSVFDISGGEPFSNPVFTVVLLLSFSLLLVACGTVLSSMSERFRRSMNVSKLGLLVLAVVMWIVVRL
jgi:hypothetical protein